MQKIIINIYLKSSNAILQTSNLLYSFIHLIMFFQALVYLFKPYETRKYHISKYLAFNTHIMNFQPEIRINYSNTYINIQKINCILLKNNHKNDRKVTKIIDILKNSGYLNRIEYFITYASKISHFIINISINPIIKKVEVNKYNQLQIPKKFLIMIFNYQIGLPTNYQNFDKSIKKIYAWYITRGFQWVDVQLTQPNNSSTIYVKIFEGKIIKSKFIYIGENNTQNKLIRNTEKLLEKELGIATGSLLNIKKIENGIKFLKKIKIINDCKYKITNFKGVFGITVKYSIFTTNYGYFYNQTNLIYCYKNLLTILKKDHYGNSFRPVQNILTKIIYLLNLKKTLISKDFRFTFYLSSLNCNYYNFATYIQLKHQIPQLFCSFLKFNNQIINTKLNFSHKLSRYNLLYPSYHIEKNIYAVKNILELKQQFTKSKVGIFFKYYLQNQIRYKSGIIYTYNLYNRRFINIKQYKLNAHSDFLCSKIQFINKSIKNNLFNFKLQLKYNHLNLIKNINSGYLLILESIFFIPIKMKANNIMIFDSYLNQSCKIKYSQAFKLPILLSNNNNNSLFFFSEINLPFVYGNNIKHFLFNNYKYSTNVYLNYMNTIEYHISICLFLSYYLFYNFIQVPSYIYINNQYIHNIGSGIQLNIPIKIIPNIRFEHRIDNYTQQYYQFRLS
uniref:hypothetical protein n=1 Tax=Caulacanthus ustulatus TaxID=31411 RepID=UPI0027DAB171|nr:hypothetical protein REQ00_pgp120 [Caulacanthus ustulatus]WCH57305.1 hypothetical protein [Caulacanthus ustulatus]